MGEMERGRKDGKRNQFLRKHSCTQTYSAILHTERISYRAKQKQQQQTPSLCELNETIQTNSLVRFFSLSFILQLVLRSKEPTEWIQFMLEYEKNGNDGESSIMIKFGVFSMREQKKIIIIV